MTEQDTSSNAMLERLKEYESRNHIVPIEERPMAFESGFMAGWRECARWMQSQRTTRKYRGTGITETGEEIEGVLSKDTFGPNDPYETKLSFGCLPKGTRLTEYRLIDEDGFCLTARPATPTYCDGIADISALFQRPPHY